MNEPTPDYKQRFIEVAQELIKKDGLGKKEYEGKEIKEKVEEKCKKLRIQYKDDSIFYPSAYSYNSVDSTTMKSRSSYPPLFERLRVNAD